MTSDEPNDGGRCQPRRVAVVGAGMAGLAAAATLRDRGVEVDVLERGRGVGGRSAHRRRDGHRFDHGAQYFTARDPDFAGVVEDWIEHGHVAPWAARVVSIAPDAPAVPVTPQPRFVGVPGMNAMARHLAQGLVVTTACAVAGLERAGDAWMLAIDGAEPRGPYDAVVLAMPPQQSARVLDTAAVRDAREQWALTPCWCAMVAFDTPLAVDFDGAFVNGSPLEWIARDSSKPGRPDGERWVLHASSSWSETRLAESPESVAAAMLTLFFGLLGLAPRAPEFLRGHRWSFARPREDAAVDCIWLADASVALCGDWCRGGRIEGAYLSGVAAAIRVCGGS